MQFLSLLTGQMADGPEPSKTTNFPSFVIALSRVNKPYIKNKVLGLREVVSPVVVSPRSGAVGRTPSRLRGGGAGGAAGALAAYDPARTQRRPDAAAVVPARAPLAPFRYAAV